jgi:hypothetical protein
VNYGRELPSPGSVRVKGIRSDTSIEFDMTVEMPTEYESGDNIQKLWAKWAIRDLDSKYKQEKNAEVLSRMVEISKKYGVLSRHTSYVCISESEIPIE